MRRLSVLQAEIPHISEIPHNQNLTKIEFVRLCKQLGKQATQTSTCHTVWHGDTKAVQRTLRILPANILAREELHSSHR